MAFSDIANSRIARSIGGVAAACVIQLATSSEGTIKRTYYDPVPILTACTGHTDPHLRIGQVFTDEECQQFLDMDLTNAARGMQDCTRVLLHTGELVAYTDFAFNEGIHAFCTSTLARKLNAGDRAGACGELLRWDKARLNGKQVTLPGLTVRRHKEYSYCMEGAS